MREKLIDLSNFGDHLNRLVAGKPDRIRSWLPHRLTTVTGIKSHGMAPG